MSKRKPKPKPGPKAPIPGPGGVGLLLYEAGATRMVRIVTWGLFAVMLGALYAAQAVYRYMIVGDGSRELASHGQRLTFALIIGGLGVLFFLGMLFYLRVYATRLVMLPDEKLLRVTTLRLFGTRDRDVPFDALNKANFHRGKFDSRRAVSVDAPYYWVRVKGGGSFLLDQNGDFKNRSALNGLLELDSAKDKFLEEYEDAQG